MSIFVQIVSYKNFDVVPTVRDCIHKASDKDNLFFGLCLQQDEDTSPELNHPRVKVVRVPPGESRGHGWARHIAQGLYEGQDYTLQVDSGTRFAENWDVELIEAIGRLPSSKPIITNFPGKYDPANGSKEMSVAYKIQPHYMVSESPLTWPAPMKNVTDFMRARYLSENFIFTRGSHCLECRYDPDLYFSEVEASITLRSFTLGYDFFHHFKPLVWRDYSPRLMHWNDDPDWWLKDRASKKRFAEMLEGRLSDFRLGEARSLRDFELYSGLDFLGRKIQRDAIGGMEPPCKYENEEQWNKSYMKDYSITVNWDSNEIERCDDYDYWYFSVEDENDQTISRQDLRPDRDGDIMAFKSNFKKISFKSQENRLPKKICVWPVSKSKGWLKKSKFDL
jgi:hypothetical protein